MKQLRRNYYHWRADAHLLSFPKCGRTWLRLMLSHIIDEHFGVETGNSLQLHKFGNRRHGIPAVLAAHDFQVVKSGVRKPQLEADKSRYAGKRVLLMIRDPRDTVVSFYHHKKFREQSFHGSVSEFIRNDFDSLATIIDYYNIWAHQRNVPEVMDFVRYEDLRHDTAETLRKVTDFLGMITISDDALRAAVEAFDFDRMKRMEAAGELGRGHTMRPADPSNTNSFKTRSGRVGGYLEELPPEDIGFVDQLVTERLDDFYAGYKYVGGKSQTLGRTG